MVNEQKWIYLGKEQKQFVLLQHSLETDHLQLFLNGSLFQEASLSELKDNTLSFFIDDELCSVSIQERKDGFYYSFQSQRSSSSQTSQERSAVRGKAKKKAIAIVTGLFFLVVVLPLSILFYTQWSKKNDLKKNGVEGLAIISLPMSGTGNLLYNIYYRYTVDDSVYQGSDDLFVNDKGVVMGPHDLPINLGDEFYITYSSKNPSNSKIDFSRLTKQQEARYKSLALQRWLQSNPISRRDTSKMESAICFVESLYRIDSMDALADFIFHDEKKAVNRSNNKKTCEERMALPETQERARNCGYRF